jgi:hypothetical protein
MMHFVLDDDRRQEGVIHQVILNSQAARKIMPLFLLSLPPVLEMDTVKRVLVKLV